MMPGFQNKWKNPNLSLTIFCCSFFHMSLKSLQNTAHMEKKYSGVTSSSPALGLMQKNITHSENLQIKKK